MTKTVKWTWRTFKKVTHSWTLLMMLFSPLMITICLPVGLSAQEKGLGLGVVFGEPTGISGKFWLDGKRAIDAGIAWSFHDKGFLHLHADILWHFPEAIKLEARLPLYVGIGARVRFDDPARVGIRVPVGLAWWVDEIPLDVFLELVPILDLTPATKFSMNGGVGVRYFFE